MNIPCKGGFFGWVKVGVVLKTHQSDSLVACWFPVLWRYKTQTETQKLASCLFGRRVPSAIPENRGIQKIEIQFFSVEKNKHVNEFW